MEDIRTVFKYFSSTNISKFEFPGMVMHGQNSVVLSDTLTGNGVHYRMHSVVVGESMDTEVYNMPYAREQRCKLFQNRNIHHMSLPFKVSHKNIQDMSFKNENYERELYK